MKTLDDGHQVTDRSYYFLLDWNDKNNFSYLHGCIKKEKLHLCNKAEYKKLFKYATKKELEKL